MSGFIFVCMVGRVEGKEVRCYKKTKLKSFLGFSVLI